MWWSIEQQPNFLEPCYSGSHNPHNCLSYALLRHYNYMRWRWWILIFMNSGFHLYLRLVFPHLGDMSYNMSYDSEFYDNVYFAVVIYFIEISF